MYTVSYLFLLGDVSLFQGLKATVEQTEVELSRLQQHPELFATNVHREHF